MTYFKGMNLEFIVQIDYSYSPGFQFCFNEVCFYSIVVIPVSALMCTRFEVMCFCFKKVYIQKRVCV